LFGKEFLTVTISEKVAYLKGLAEGLDLDTAKSKEAKLISVMIGILEEVGLSIEDMEENVTSLGEEIDAVSDDLADVEKTVFGEDDEDDDADEDFFEVECPSCGADIEIDQDVLDAGVVECPGCGEKFAIDLSDEEERHCCGRGQCCGKAPDEDDEEGSAQE